MRGLCLVLLIFIADIYAYDDSVPVHPNAYHDQLRNNAAKRLVNMSYELVVEAKLLQRQMQPIQNYYQGQMTYEIGYVMGKIRERYKRMIEIYKQAHYMTKHLYYNENLTNYYQLNLSIAIKPGIKMYYPINWVINMEYMRLFEVDIDKLIEVLENIPSYALKEIDVGNNSNSMKQPTIPFEKPPEGFMSATLPPHPHEQTVKEKPRGPRPTRTGEGPGYPGDVGFLRSGPPSVLNEPPPNVPNEPPPSVANEPPPSVPNEPLPSVPNEPSTSVAIEPPTSVPNEPPLGQTNEPPPGRPNELPPDPPSQAYESPQSQSYKSPPSYPNKTPLSLSNEPPPDPERQSYEVTQSQSYDSPPNFPSEPPPDPERQSYEVTQSQSYDSPSNFPSEPPPDPERQSYEVTQSQSYDSPSNFPSEPPPDPERQSYEPPPDPPSWPTEPPAPSYGKVHFGSADTNFRTEEELKQYYRALYRAKHNGINDKYDNLY